MPLPESSINVEENVLERSNAAWRHKHYVPNQNFVVLSIVDTGKPPAAIKIFGTYASVAEANEASAAISGENDFFDVYVADTNAWLPVPCSREFVENTHYQEQKMNTIKEGFALLKEKNAKTLVDTIKQDREDKKARAKADN